MPTMSAGGALWSGINRVDLRSREPPVLVFVTGRESALFRKVIGRSRDPLVVPRLGPLHRQTRRRGYADTRRERRQRLGHLGPILIFPETIQMKFSVGVVDLQIHCQVPL